MTDLDVAFAPDKVKDIFHLMMQEYVLPADAARKIGKKIHEDGNMEVFSFCGFIKDEIGSSYASRINCGEPLNIYLREDRAVVEEIVTGRMIGSISFDEDELYYVVLPLLEDPKVDAHATITRVDSSRRNKEHIRVAIELSIPKDLADILVSNGKLIKELLRKLHQNDL